MLAEYLIFGMVMASVLLCVIRMIKGPTVYDRILANNSFGTVTVILIVLLGFYFDYPSAFDIALIYALVNFITTIAFLKFFREKSFRK